MRIPLTWSKRGPAILIRRRWSALGGRVQYLHSYWPWRRWVLNQVRAFVDRMEERPRWGSGHRWVAGKVVGGKVLAFAKRGRNLGHDVVDCVSKNGGFSVGTIDWSNQWNRPRFKAHPEAVFDQQCIAEIYAAMKELQ